MGNAAFRTLDQLDVNDWTISLLAIPGVFCCLSGLNTVHGQARTAKATAKATGQRTVLPRGSADLFRPPQSHKISISFKIYQDDHQDDQWISMDIESAEVPVSFIRFFCPFLVIRIFLRSCGHGTGPSFFKMIWTTWVFPDEMWVSQISGTEMAKISGCSSQNSLGTTKLLMHFPEFQEFFSRGLSRIFSFDVFGFTSPWNPTNRGSIWVVELKIVKWGHHSTLKTTDLLYVFSNHH